MLFRSVVLYVLGKPIMYRTTREFLIHFGLSSLAELPTLKEFEELGRLAFEDTKDFAVEEAPAAAEAPEPTAALVEEESNG